jgi:hypothetical protein
MMRNELRYFASFVALHGAAVCQAALPIDLEVAVQQAAPFGAMQEWGRALSEMDLAAVRLRGANAGDQPSITPSGTAAAPRFRVVGVLNDRDQLVLPGGAFGRGDVARLKNFFEALPGKVAEQGVERGIFGLTRPQFEQLYNDLSLVVTDSTVGLTLPDAIDSLTGGLSVPVDIDAKAQAQLKRAKPLSIELKDMTRGTATALALRTAGLALASSQPPGKPMVLRIVAVAPNQAAWPVGWKPEQPPQQVAPAMYRFTTVEISGYTLAQALEALAPHLGVPVMFDEFTLSQLQIDFSKIEVKFPNRKTYVRRALDSVLAQGRVTGELRTDEGDRPFYWITRFGPVSPKALGADPAITSDDGAN